jgi:hypothetical protein
MNSKLPYALLEVLSPRNVQDLKLKMLAINRTPQKKLDELFLDMCDSGTAQYIESIQEESPEKTKIQIMKELFLRNNQKK